jgi:hypothetical protein
MQAGSLVLLDDEPVATLFFDFGRGLGSFFETALSFVFFQCHRRLL